eukprot:10543857-Alexandrium_andersonii.AAC.1
MATPRGSPHLLRSPRRRWESRPTSLPPLALDDAARSGQGEGQGARPAVEEGGPRQVWRRRPEGAGSRADGGATVHAGTG